MSDHHYLRCDSCGKILQLPTTRDAAGPWQRLSRSVDGVLVFRHWCGQCNNIELWKRLEAQ